MDDSRLKEIERKLTALSVVAPYHHTLTEELIAEIRRLRGKLHPWYGDCDGFADGDCSECEALNDSATVLYREKVQRADR